jgi:hypothetical protein
MPSSFAGVLPAFNPRRYAHLCRSKLESGKPDNHSVAASGNVPVPPSSSFSNAAVLVRVMMQSPAHAENVNLFLFGDSG